MSSRGVRSERDGSDDRGQAGGVEALAFGLLIFVVGTLLVANTWAVIDAKMAVDAAAREGARSYVEARSAAAAQTAADRAAREAITAQGRTADRLQIQTVTRPGFERCARATVTARYPVAAINLPIIGGFGHRFWVSSSHSELVDPYAAGLSGATACG